MKKIIYLTTLLVLSFLFSFNICPAFEISLQGQTSAHVYFSPQGGCTDAILKSISTAKHEILIQAYSFRSPIIAQALIDAGKRGVKVEMIMDKSERQEGFTPAILMANAGIPVHLDGKHAVANNRVIIVDRQTLMTGSFNFNNASEEMNAENLLILQSKELSALYRDNWLNHLKHSEPL